MTTMTATINKKKKKIILQQNVPFPNTFSFFLCKCVTITFFIIEQSFEVVFVHLLLNMQLIEFLGVLNFDIIRKFVFALTLNKVVWIMLRLLKQQK